MMGVATWLQNLVADVQAGKQFDEDKYIPYLWRCEACDPDMFIETAMHLLGHGIVGTLIEEIKKVMTHHGLWTTFIEFVNPMLGDIASFRLDWCKVKTLPKANWLGEDCFGFARLLYYLFRQFTSQYDLVTHRDDTTSDQVKALTQLMHSFTAMMYSVMCKDKVHKKRHDILIRIFLTCCSRFCKEYYNDDIKEFWANKQNF